MCIVNYTHGTPQVNQIIPTPSVTIIPTLQVKCITILEVSGNSELILWSLQVMATSSPIFNLPEAPEVSVVLLLNSTAVQVMWTQVNDTSGYILEVRLLDGTLVQQVEVFGASVTTINNLTPYTSYYIQVASVGIGGNTGPFSEHRNVSTPEAGRAYKKIYRIHSLMYQRIASMQLSTLTYTCLYKWRPSSFSSVHCLYQYSSRPPDQCSGSRVG